MENTQQYGLNTDKASAFYNGLKDKGRVKQEGLNAFLENAKDPEYAKRFYNALSQKGYVKQDGIESFMNALYGSEPKGVPYADAPARSSMIDPLEVAKNAAKNLQEQRDAEQKRLEDFTSKALSEHNTDTTLGLQERIRQNQLLSDAIDEELNKSLKEKASKEDFEDYVKNPEKYRAKQRQGILSADNLNRNVQLSKLQERKKALDEDTRKLMGEDFQTRLDEIEIKRIAAGIKTGRYEIDDNGTIVDISRPIPTLDSGAGYYRYEKKKVSDFVLKRAKELASSMNDEDATMFSENDHILDMTVRNLNKALRMSKLDNDAGGWSKFLSGVRTTWDGGRVLPYLNLLELRDLMSYRNALGRIESGEGTEADKELVASQLDKETAQRLYNEGFAGKLAMGTLESLSFMVDMVIGGKVGSFIKIGEGAAKGLMKAGIKKEVIRGAERLAAQAATLPISPAPYLDIERRQIQNYHAGYDPDGQVSVSKSENAESVASSALNAFAQNLISRSVETVVGPVAEKMLSGIGNGAKWLVTGGGKVKFAKDAIENIGKFLEKSKGGLTGEAMQAFNMQNFAGEMVEEIAEEPLQRLLVAMTAVEKDYAEANGTGRWSGMYDREFWGQTLGTIGLMQMLFRLPGISAKGADMAHNALGMHTGLQMLNDRQRVALKEIMKMDDDNQRAIALSRMMNGTTQEERQGIVRYVVSRVAQNMMTSYQQAEAQQNDMAAYRNTLMQITADTEGDVLFAEEKSTGNRYVIKNISPNDPAMVAYPAELQPDGMYKFGKPRVMDGSAFNLVGAKFVSIDELIAEKEQHDAQINEQQDQVAEAEMDNALNPDADAQKVYVAGHEFNYTDPKGNLKTVARGSRIVPVETVQAGADPNTMVQVAITKPGGSTSMPGVMSLSEFQNMVERGYIAAEEQTDADTATDVQTDADGNPVAEEKAEGVGTSIPQDDKGRTQYEAAPLEDTVRSIYEESGLSAEQADAFVNKKLTAARSEVEKLAKKEPQIDTFDEIPLYQRAHEQWKQQMDAAQAKAEYWKSVKGARATEEVQGAEGENAVAEEAEPAATATVEENGIIGRSATEEEAEGIISQMEANAEEAPEVELTPENWTEQFGEKGETNTPIGTVKMGENQLAKMFLRKRDKEFGMIFPTLTDPDLIIEEESSAKDGSEERPSSYLFVKTFLRDGKKVKHYASVTVQKEGMEVVVSNHYLEESALKGKLQNGKVLYTKEALLSNSSDGHLAEHQNGVPDLLPTQENNASSENKGTEVSEEKQVRLPENPVAVMYESLLSENEGNETEAVDTAQQMVANKTAELEQARKIQAKGKTIDAIQAAKRAKREKVTALETEVKFWKDVAAYPEAKRQAEETARKLQKRIDAQQRAEQARRNNPQRLRLMDRDKALGEPLSLEEYVLRRIATGATKFLWDGTSQGTGGLREHGGGKQFMLQYVDKNLGKVPEVVADDMEQDIRDNYPEFGNVTASDILDVIEGIGVGEQSFSDLMARAEELHNRNDYDAQAQEEAEEAEREERAREEAAADIAQASVEYMSDEEYEALSRPEFVGEMFNTDGTPKRVAPASESGVMSFEEAGEKLDDIEAEWNERIMDYIYEHYPTQATVSATTNSEQGLREREAMKKDERLKQLRAEMKAAVDKAVAAEHEAYLREKAEGGEEVRMRRGEPRQDNDLSEEERGIVERAKADGTYLKTPNGKPTKLSPKQWAQVRTKAFKDWFGDWELPTKTVEIVNKDQQKGDIITEHGFKNFDEARAWAKKNIVKEVTHDEIGKINISSNAVDKYLSKKAVNKSDNKDVHLITLRVLPSVIENSIVGEIHTDEKNDPHVRDIVRLFGCIDIDGKEYRVKTTVKRYNSNNEKTKAYSYEITEIELLDGTHGDDRSPLPRTSSNSISAAKLLQGVKKSNSNEETQQMPARVLQPTSIKSKLHGALSYLLKRHRDCGGKQKDKPNGRTGNSSYFLPKRNSGRRQPFPLFR